MIITDSCVQPSFRQNVSRISSRQEKGVTKSNYTKLETNSYNTLPGIPIYNIYSLTKISKEDVWFTNTSCTGSEASIYKCKHDGWDKVADTCRLTKYAGVHCFSSGYQVRWYTAVLHGPSQSGQFILTSHIAGHWMEVTGNYAKYLLVFEVHQMKAVLFRKITEVLPRKIRLCECVVK